MNALVNVGVKDQNELKVANFIIGGTEKAGTTSVFSYLSEHPSVSGSLAKETDFFRKDLASIAQPLKDYANHFRQNQHDAIVMEASPGYLGESNITAHQIGQLLPNAQLLFILREPSDRLYSSYNFHRNKLDLPENLSFDDYVSLCFDYEDGKSAASLGIDEWYLKTLRFGRYAQNLDQFHQHLNTDNVKVMFFEDLRNDVGSFMHELSDFLNIDDTFWADYEFERKNVTFSGRNKALHKLAMLVNGQAERFLRQRPQLKSKIVALYKSVNQDQEGYVAMSDSSKDRLNAYYQSSNQQLRDIYKLRLPDNW